MPKGTISASIKSGRANGVGETMKHLLNMMVRFHRDRAGLTIVEYAVAGGVITVAVVAAFLTLGDAVAVSIAGLADRISGS